MDSLPFEYQKKKYWEFYCPVCKSQRRTFYWPSPRPKHYVALSVFGGILTLGLWNWFEFKSIFLIFPIWGVFEFIYRARARQSLICPNCGFDPYLYKHDVKLARQKIEEFFRDKNRSKAEKIISEQTNVEGIEKTTNPDDKEK